MKRAKAPSRKARWKRLVAASLRDGWIVFRDSWVWLGLWLLLWLGFTMAIWAGTRPVLAFHEALYQAFSQMTLNPVPLPEPWWLQLLFYLAPALNILLLARGALNMGILLFDKRNRREAWQMALASTYRDHIIVCGLGKIGYRVVGQLLASGCDIVVIDAHNDGPFHELVMGQHVPVIIGDARQPELLQQAGLHHATSLTVVTGDDLTNLDIALTAREQHPDIHIVMRVFNDSLAGKLSSAFNIQTAFSTSALAAPTLAAAALGRGITNALYVAGKLLSTVEITVERDGIFDGRLIQTVENQHDISVLYRRGRNGEDLRPRGDERLTSGDQLVIIGPLAAINYIQAQNKPNAAPHAPYRL